MMITQRLERDAAGLLKPYPRMLIGRTECA
ncbi:hypothetical protein SIAM614_20610 [Stappia aggregata IAM 12614]|uniref:Uncharacterized protein n=1 Tax=Roseibium aggregatum (strain ATCC 25650 / DSM 13394 / JCM 20685 / NBRC 16684 / NCIMB 2208 / IAM 12614 / B1) TaxID=384765 RepID=A0NYD3_ROSAI|nr:hypothetical protein SIAM614_20610 [Stappia aggregata IAM 12614] [Roseibium aggregatum IAM 12614]